MHWSLFCHWSLPIWSFSVFWCPKRIKSAENSQISKDKQKNRLQRAKKSWFVNLPETSGYKSPASITSFGQNNSQSTQRWIELETTRSATEKYLWIATNTQQFYFFKGTGQTNERPAPRIPYTGNDASDQPRPSVLAQYTDSLLLDPLFRDR